MLDANCLKMICNPMFFKLKNPMSKTEGSESHLCSNSNIFDYRSPAIHVPKVQVLQGNENNALCPPEDGRGGGGMLVIVHHSLDYRSIQWGGAQGYSTCLACLRA